MDKFRNSSAEIYVLEKSVEFCGKTMRKSKKKVKWIIMHRFKEHTIVCTISFMSGKKNVTHNGMTIVNTVSSDDLLVAVIMLGTQRVSIRIEKDRESLKFEGMEKSSSHNPFLNFKNILSGPPSDIYSKFFSNT